MSAGPDRMFESLGVPNYRRYFLGESVSVIGNWMQNVGLAWLVLTLTGSGTVVGLLVGVRYLPVLLLSLWGGALADRSDMRRLLEAGVVTIRLDGKAIAATAKHAQGTYSGHDNQLTLPTGWKPDTAVKCALLVHELAHARDDLASSDAYDRPEDRLVEGGVETSRAFTDPFSGVEGLRDFSRLEQDPARVRAVDRPFLGADITAIGQRFGWAPSRSIDEAIADLWRAPDLSEALMAKYDLQGKAA